jgi:flagellar basal body-associated protein FliL
MISTREVGPFILVSLTALLSACGNEPEPTKAEQSSYNHDIKLATTSSGLTKADLAWHAMNTYGWDCAEVISRGEQTPDGYFLINCGNGKKLRVYPRAGKHPKITNESGGYSDSPQQSQVENTITHKLDTFTVQLSSDGELQFLQINIELKLANQQCRNKIQTHMPEIRDEILRLLSSKTAKDIESSYGKDKLAISIKSTINSAIGENAQNGVSEVLFASFEIQ